MKENLYQYFSCDTKEELYVLVKKNDESVRELIDYLNSKEYFNLDASNRIRDIDDIKRVIQNGEINIPNKDEITFLTLDAGCTIIDNKTFNFNNNTLYDVTKSLYSDKMTYFISVIGENFQKEAKNIRSDFISLGYREIEAVIKKNEHDFYKLRYGVDNSSDEEQIVHHLPYPSVETYLLGNVPSDQKFYIILHLQVVVYIHVGNHHWLHGL